MPHPWRCAVPEAPVLVTKRSKSHGIVCVNRDKHANRPTLALSRLSRPFAKGLELIRYVRKIL